MNRFYQNNPNSEVQMENIINRSPSSHQSIFQRKRSSNPRFCFTEPGQILLGSNSSLLNNNNGQSTSSSTSSGFTISPPDSPNVGIPDFKFQNQPSKRVQVYYLTDFDLVSSFDQIDKRGLKPVFFKDFYFYIVPLLKDSTSVQPPPSPAIQMDGPDHQINYPPPQPSLSSTTMLMANQSAIDIGSGVGIENNLSIVECGLVVVYEFGVVVCWDLTPELEYLTLTMLDQLVEKQSNKSSSDGANYSSPKLLDSMTFYQTADPTTTIFNDQIFLEENSDIYTKISISHALSISVKLSTYEETLEKLLMETSKIQNSLIKHGKIHNSSKHVGILTGNLLKVKHSLQTYSTTFQSFTEYFSNGAAEKYENCYETTFKYLDIALREKSILKKIKFISDCTEICRSDIHARGAFRLELIVVILIFIELVFMVLTFCDSLH
eukprot:gene1506-1898_t